MAGPITLGDQESNVERAMAVADKLVQAGFAPLVPHLTWFWQERQIEPYAHELWLDIDRPWVLASDALLRIPGESKGADIEVAWATEAGIPVFNRADDLIAAFASTRIIGLTGHAGVGKDAAASFLKPHGYQRLALADPLKGVARAIGWDGSKDVQERCICGMAGGRELLQLLGTEGVRDHLGRDVWVQALRRRIRPGSRVVVSDVRFVNEAEAVRSWGGEVWRIERPGYPGDDHASERGVRQIMPDRVICNDGTLDDLRVRVEEAMA